jgi:DNA-directed RNA polymerase I, II, and III subunit RPABC1
MHVGTDYVPGIIYENMPKFLQYRNIISDYKFTSLDEFSSRIKHFGIVHISGKKVKGGHFVYIILMAPDSKYATKSPDFKKLLGPLITTAMNSKQASGRGLEIIIISEKELTNHIIKAINDDYLAKYGMLHIEHYIYKLFKLVVPEHVMQPKFTLTTRDEAAEFCKEYYTDIDKFPKISSKSDAMAVWMGLRPGDVVKIERTSESAGVAIVYRYCIP